MTRSSLRTASVCIGVALSFVASAIAQTAGTGAIVGRVIDQASHTPLRIGSSISPSPNA